MTKAVYIVQLLDEEEGLMGIARRLYGDANRWPEIYEANRAVIGNNPDVIRCGQQLVISAIHDEGATRGDMHIYVVQPTDIHEGLRGIARRLYGDVAKWREIYAVNRGVIGSDATQLEAGQILIIP